MSFLRGFTVGSALAAVLILTLLAPSPAQAWLPRPGWGGGLAAGTPAGAAACLSAARLLWWARHLPMPRRRIAGFPGATLRMAGCRRIGAITEARRPARLGRPDVLVMASVATYAR